MDVDRVFSKAKRDFIGREGSSRVIMMGILLAMAEMEPLSVRGFI